MAVTGSEPISAENLAAALEAVAGSKYMASGEATQSVSLGGSDVSDTYPAFSPAVTIPSDGTYLVIAKATYSTTAEDVESVTMSVTAGSNTMSIITNATAASMTETSFGAFELTAGTSLSARMRFYNGIKGYRTYTGTITAMVVKV